MNNIESIKTIDQIHKLRRLRSAQISLVVALLLLLAKSIAYFITGSIAILSDTLESIVNLVAAFVLIWAIIITNTPPDRNHPYGHGKVEAIASAIEGAMIFFAGIFIVIESIDYFVRGNSIYKLEFGLIIVLIAAIVNGLLAYHLLRQGKELNSMALVADGKHILTDVWTSLSILAGLLIISITGWKILDPIIGISMALFLFYTGYLVIKGAINQLMDAADERILKKIVDSLASSSKPAWINFHNLRAWQSGYSLFVDTHLVVPSYYTAQQLHRIYKEISKILINNDNGEVTIHFDPCRPLMCCKCRMQRCPIRKNKFKKSSELSVKTIILDNTQKHI